MPGTVPLSSRLKDKKQLESRGKLQKVRKTTLLKEDFTRNDKKGGFTTADNL